MAIQIGRWLDQDIAEPAGRELFSFRVSGDLSDASFIKQGRNQPR